MSLMPAFKIGIWNAWIFMSAFLLQMLVMIFSGKHCREKSHVPKEARQNKLENTVGILGNFIWLMAMGYSIFLPLKLGTIWFYIGLFIFIIGLILIVATTFSFITTPANHVISKGVYRFSRHPMYLATFLITLGAGIASGSWLFILLGIILALCLHREALIEERHCLNKFGRVYQEYLNRVPRWFGINRKNSNIN